MNAPVASLETIEGLWNALPAGRITGNNSKIDHERVLFVAQLIDNSGVAEKIDEWQTQDRVASAPGGRKRTVSTRTVLILLLLLTVEHTAQLVEEMAFIPYQRLHKESLDYLDLGGSKAMSKGRRRSRRQWYFVCYRALRRALTPIDPRPLLKTAHGKFPTLIEVDAMKAGWETEHLKERHDRLKLVSSCLIEASMQLVPKKYADNWKGDICVDASVIPAYARRGAPFGSKHGPIEGTAGWYMRDSNHQVTTNSKKVKKAIFGWDATVLVQTNHDPSQPAGFPQLIVGMGLSVPGRELIGTARDLFADVVRRGHPVGRATGDRGYGPMAQPENYQIPLRQLGYDLVSDYTIKQLGKNSGAEYEGAIQVEGAWYCPSMPPNLINATKLYRAGTIDHTTWRKRIVQRRDYMFRPKEKPDAQGSVPWMCPARGPGATVLCPLVETCAPNPDTLTAVTKPPAVNKRGKACTNKTSLTIPITAGAKHAQALQFGSREWQVVYSSDRNTIEGTNGFFKDSSKEAVGDAGRRRLRGIAAQHLSLCLLFVTVNLRKIEKFRDEIINYSADDHAVRAERKLAGQRKRKSRDDRRAPWDNFTKKPGYKEDAGPPGEE